MSDIKREVGLKCLHCGKWQFPPNRDYLHNWNCGYCHAGFVSLAMLTNLVTRDIVEQVNHQTKVSTEGRPCPKCRSQMLLSYVVKGEAEVELDHCRHCHLLWFDAGGLMKLLRLGGADVVIEQEPAMVGVRAPRKIEQVEEQDSAQFVPWATMLLFATCAVLGVLSSRFPSSQMHFLFVLIFAGSWVEKKLGVMNYLGLFAAAGFVGQFIYAVHDLTTLTIVAPSAGACGVVAYGLMIAPYREVFFPKDSFKSSQVTLWLVVITVVAFNLYIGWDYFHMAFAKLAGGAQAPTGAGSQASWLIETVNTSTFRANFMGFFMGLMWIFRSSEK